MRDINNDWQDRTNGRVFPKGENALLDAYEIMVLENNKLSFQEINEISEAFEKIMEMVKEK